MVVLGSDGPLLSNAAGLQVQLEVIHTKLRHLAAFYALRSLTQLCMTAECGRLSMMQAFFQPLQVSALLGKCV